MSVICYEKRKQDRRSVDRDLTKLVLRAILAQDNPKLQLALVDKLATGPLGAQVAGCIDELSQLGLSVRALPETRQGSTRKNLRSFPHP
jgi:hypothetical protein